MNPFHCTSVNFPRTSESSLHQPLFHCHRPSRSVSAQGFASVQSCVTVLISLGEETIVMNPDSVRVMTNVVQYLRLQDRKATGYEPLLTSRTPYLMHLRVPKDHKHPSTDRQREHLSLCYTILGRFAQLHRPQKSSPVHASGS